MNMYKVLCKRPN